MLVIGAAGFIGSAFRRDPAAGELYTTRTPRAPGFFRFDPVKDDLSAIPGVERMANVLMLYAEREPDRCFADPEGTARLNVESPKRLIRQCVNLGLKPIFASSELVFDGRHGLYTETDTPSPVLEYGRQKLAVEHYLMETCPNGLVLRFPKTFGLARGDRSLFTNWLQQIDQGVDVLQCATDQSFSLQLVDSVPSIIRSLASLQMKGVMHLGDGARHSRIELLYALLDHLQGVGYRTPRVYGVSIDDLALPERRPKDVSLDASLLARSIGVQPPHVSDYLDRLHLRREAIR